MILPVRFRTGEFSDKGTAGVVTVRFFFRLCFDGDVPPCPAALTGPMPSPALNTTPRLEASTGVDKDLLVLTFAEGSILLVLKVLAPDVYGSGGLRVILSLPLISNPESADSPANDFPDVILCCRIVRSDESSWSTN